MWVPAFCVDVVGAPSLAACATTPPSLDAKGPRRDAIANRGVVAICPPAEDVMVGDALLFGPGARDFDGMRRTVGALRAALDCAGVLPSRPQPANSPGLPNNPPAATSQPATFGTERAREQARLMGIADGILTPPSSAPVQASARMAVGRFGNLARPREPAAPAAAGTGLALHVPLVAAAPLPQAALPEHQPGAPRPPARARGRLPPLPPNATMRMGL